MTRFLGGGKLVDTTANGEGIPHTFFWDGDHHPVQSIADRWRVDVEWWRWRIWREYFKVTTETGLLVTIYHDLLRDQWYLQRVYD